MSKTYTTLSIYFKSIRKPIFCKSHRRQAYIIIRNKAEILGITIVPHRFSPKILFNE
ncbi:MAG: hypothetical protein ACTSWC_00215 [Promethearchaeota archaeon]